MTGLPDAKKSPKVTVSPISLINSTSIGSLSPKSSSTPISRNSGGKSESGD